MNFIIDAVRVSAADLTSFGRPRGDLTSTVSAGHRRSENSLNIFLQNDEENVGQSFALLRDPLTGSSGKGTPGPPIAALGLLRSLPE